MSKTVYNADVLTGGGARALDSYLIAVLDNGDRAIVFDGEKTRVYKFDSTRTDAEFSPKIIRPDDYGAGGITGVWIEKEFSQNVKSAVEGGSCNLSPADPVNDIQFEETKTLDSTQNVTLESTFQYIKRADASFSAGTNNGGMLNGSFSANSAYFFVMMGDGINQVDFGFLDEDDIASIGTYVSNAGFEYYKILGYQHTIGASAQWADYHMNGPWMINRTASENVATTGITTTAGTVNHAPYIIDDYTEMIMYGARDATETTSFVSALSTSGDTQFAIGGTAGTTTDSNINIWGKAPKSYYVPYDSAREFKATVGTVDLLIHGKKVVR